jgi:hypothetical protein
VRAISGTLISTLIKPKLNLMSPVFLRHRNRGAEVGTQVFTRYPSVSWTKHPLWRDSGSGPIPADMVKYDLAVVVFPDNTVSTFASVSAPPSVGQNVWLAGFGASSWSGRIGDPASGQSYLRWGGNTVDERSGDLIIFSGVNSTSGGAQYGNGRDAAGAVGDSGGPLFTDSSFKNLVGVASGAVPAAGSQLKDLYVDLSSSSARSFLRSQGVAVP